MRVSGELTPDITGDFERADDYDGRHTWTDPVGGWSIWYDVNSARYVITPTIGTVPAEDPFWNKSTEPFTQAPGTYDQTQGAVGLAEVTSI